MGNCLQVVSRTTPDLFGPNRRNLSAAKSIPISWDRVKWTCQIPITASQLKRKRDEFWDTAPAFEGRKEIWDALRAATDALYRNELEFAQAIVDGANIIAPTGSLLDCYDELGSRYQIPIYVLWDPINIIDDISPIPSSVVNHVENSATSSERISAPVSTSQPVSPDAPSSTEEPSEDAARNSSSTLLSSFSRILKLSRNETSQSSESKTTNRNRSKRSSKHSKSGNSRRHSKNMDASTSNKLVTPKEFALKLRFSSGEDYQCTVYLHDLVAEAKRKVELVSDWPASRQRWFCAGRMLHNQMRIEDCQIPDGFLVQVIVHSPFEPESIWQRTRQAHFKEKLANKQQLAQQIQQQRNNNNAPGKLVLSDQKSLMVEIISAN